MLSLEELTRLVATGEIDTVIVAFTDMQGRLMGKRLHGEFFVEEIEAGHSVEGCNYLLALEMEMDPVPGYEIASWEQGYGDFDTVPDLATLRRIPWLEATALVLVRRPVARRSSRRAVTASGAARAGRAGGSARADADDGLRARVLSPPETYEEAHAQGLSRACPRPCRTSSTTTCSPRPTTSR